MHDLRPSELKIGAFLGLENRFPVLGGHIPMKIPIGTEIPIGGSYPEIRQAGFRVALVCVSLHCGRKLLCHISPSTIAP